MDRVILHCDMNSFFCSVELLEHPELADKPVAVAGCADDRHGIILAKNQLAKSFGVVTPETIYSAKKKCPKLILLEPHHEKYSHYCHLINDIYLRYTDMVEPFSIDESWLDVTGSLQMFKKNGKELADEIRTTVYKELGLTLSAGVSYNKVFAKMGSDYKKPYATTEITRENFKDLLWPLPAGEMFFVGRATASRLKGMNINTIGDIANSDPRLMTSVFGKMGQQMIDNANGLDEDPVAHWGDVSEAKSVGNGITFRRNLVGEADIRTAVTAISDHVAQRLRRHGYLCQGVKIDIKSPDFITITRQRKLDEPTNLSKDIMDAALKLIADNWYIGNPIRLLTITAINIIEKGETYSTQISFFDSPEKEESRKKEKQLEYAIDQIRSKHGNAAVTSASLLNNDLGIKIEEW